MHASKLTPLAILAVISSCGATEDGLRDTRDVPTGTRRGDEAASAVTAAPTPGGEEVPPIEAPAPKIAGFVGTRFVVFDTLDHTIVFDAETERAFAVRGHPVTEKSDDFDMWTEARFSPTSLATRVVASDDGGAMMLKTDAGLEFVDLRRRGAPLTGWRGEASGVAIAPDGSLFAAWTPERLDLVRVADGARASYPYRADRYEPLEVRWTGRGAYWTDADGLRFVETSTLREDRAAMPSPRVTTSKDGSTFVVWRPGTRGEPGVVEVRRSGLARTARIVSAFVTQVVVDDDGGRVAWSEHSEAYDEPADDAPTFLHTLDVASGVHARFRAQGRPCSIAPEHIVGFEGGALKTDAECSPGCPSIPSQAELITYDFASGRKLREWLGESLPPFNDALAEHTAKGDKLARRFGVLASEGESLPFVHHPSAPVVLVAASSGLRLAAESDGRVLADLPRSAGFGPAGVHFTPDGRRIVGAASDGHLAVWDARDGRRVWASR
ncbi:MAG: hypothetical protein KF795_01390 [Labilithrix sp.]|nr:hypothetical protein [Labilithrix sp.]